MSYYESDLDDALYDDDYDDVLVEDYDDDIDEDYEDAIVEDYEEAKKKNRRGKPRRQGPLARARARRKARAAIRKAPPPPPPPAVKPARVARAFGKVESELKKIKGESNLANEGIIIQALSLLVNSPTLVKQTATVIDVDANGHPIFVMHNGQPTTQYQTKQVSYVSDVDDKLLQNLLILGTIYLSTTKRIPPQAPYFALAVFAILPNLFKGVKLTDSTASNTATDFNFDAKSVLVLAAAAFMVLGKNNRRAA